MENSLPLSETPFFSQPLDVLVLPSVSVVTVTHIESTPPWPFSMEPQTPLVVPESELTAPDSDFVVALDSNFVVALDSESLMAPYKSDPDTVVPESKFGLDLAVDGFVVDGERRPWSHPLDDGHRALFLKMLAILCPRALPFYT